MGAAVASVGYLKDKLREHFGFRRFRPGQLQAVRSALSGRDALVVMPTGSGKSLCFQLPALELDGTTVVVSPLLALMKDQADALRDRGIRVAVVNSTLSPADRAEADRQIAAGEVEFVYTTPEQLARPVFRDVLKRHTVDMVVVDEAHCVSQWGHDFRPEYLSLWEAVEELGRPPVLALTATATPDVVEDILARLHIPDAEVVSTGFYRPNIAPTVLRLKGDAVKRRKLVELLHELPGTGIVYAATTKAVDELTDYLDDWGLPVVGYHGKMATKRREAAQDLFMAGKVKALAATNAFGLGIDKPDIRFVVHYHMPGCLEAYYQEIGRAGRDGGPADAVLFYDPADQKLQRFFAGGRYPDDSDLVNAYHAVQRAAAGGAFAADAALAVSPLPRSRMKVCLDLFAGKGIVRREATGDYRLTQPHLTRDDLARAAESYRERQERDRRKAAEVAAFAERRGCRWRAVLDYFESGDELPAGGCGTCDNC